MSRYKDMMIDNFSDCLSSNNKKHSEGNKYLARGLADCKSINKSFPAEDSFEEVRSENIEKMNQIFKSRQKGKGLFPCLIVLSIDNRITVPRNERRRFLNYFNKHPGLLFSVKETGKNNRLHKNSVLNLQKEQIKAIKGLKNKFQKQGLNIFFKKINHLKKITELHDYLSKELNKNNNSERVNYSH